LDLTSFRVFLEIPDPPAIPKNQFSFPGYELANGPGITVTSGLLCFVLNPGAIPSVRLFFTSLSRECLTFLCRSSEPRRLGPSLSRTLL